MFKVEATMLKDAEVVSLGTAHYDSKSDRLIWQAADPTELWLSDVDYIKFTKDE